MPVLNFPKGRLEMRQLVLHMLAGMGVSLFSVWKSKGANLKLAPEPEPIDIDLQRTAVVVVDMQNAFISKGGMFDLRGFDVTPNQKIIEPIKKVCDAARKNGVKVIYIAHVLSPDLREVGPDSSFRYKSVKLFREDAQWQDKYLIRGPWGADIVDALKPQKNDIYVEKSRFSVFFGTNLDVTLKTLDIKYLPFTGCATNICVEASIRDASHLGYFPVMLTDATINNGLPFMQE